MRTVSFFAIVVLALLPSLARAADLEPTDYQAALDEANSHISWLSVRVEQLAATIAQQAREVAKLKAEVGKAKAPQTPPKE